MPRPPSYRVQDGCWNCKHARVTWAYRFCRFWPKDYPELADDHRENQGVVRCGICDELEKRDEP